MEFQDAVKTAEEAVSAMKDAKLKEIAFEKILEKLLASEKQVKRRKSTISRNNSGGSKPSPSKRKDGIIDWVRDLVASDFFKSPRSAKAILDELEQQSHHLDRLDLIWPLRQLCHKKVLRRKKLAPDEGKAEVWHWSNW